MKPPVAKVLNLNLSKREKIQQANSTILIAVAIASVLISMSLVMGNFLWKQKQYNDRVYKEKKIARNILRQNVSNANTLQQKFQDIESPTSLANSQTILDALPGDYDNPALRSSLEALAVKNSLKITSLTASDQEGKVQEHSLSPTPQQIPFTLTVKGKYDQIRALTLDLEHTIRPMHVQSIVLSGTDQDMQADIDVVTYFQPTKDVGITTKEVK